MMARTRKSIRYTLGDRIFLTVDFIILVLLLIAIAYPLIYIFFASFNAQVTKMGLSLFPEEWTVQGYKAVFEYKFIWSGYRNTLIYTAVGTVINLFVTICCAYQLSRKDLKGRGIIMVMCMITMYFSGGLIPTYLVVKDLGILNSMWAIVLPGAMSVYNMIVMRTYFDTQIPQELLESAQLDGCGNLNFLKSIVLPLSVPILAVVGLFYAVGHWNSYFNAMIYLTERDRYPLQVILRDILIMNTVDPSESSMDLNLLQSMEERQNVMKYSLIIVSSVPVLILYPFIQKYFVKGIMIGAIKG